VIARKIITCEIILVASPAYLNRKGTPQRPEDLAQHDGLRFKTAGPRPLLWHLVHSEMPHETREVEVNTVMWSNHTGTLLRAAIDGIGLTFSSVDVVAPYLSSGQLVQVLQPWTYGQLTLYAALPSRQFLPQRTRVFLDFLTEQTQLLVAKALINAAQR
jgi:DNA-binding transcriptional LysR family regulator